MGTVRKGLLLREKPPGVAPTGRTRCCGLLTSVLLHAVTIWATERLCEWGRPLHAGQSQSRHPQTQEGA